MAEQYCCKCCKDMDIELKHLISPELYLDEDAQYFLKLWGLEQYSLEFIRQNSTLLGSGEKVKIRIPCSQLTEEGLCSVYERRPQLCREYRCESRVIMPEADRCEPERRYFPLKVANG